MRFCLEADGTLRRQELYALHCLVVGLDSDALLQLFRRVKTGVLCVSEVGKVDCFVCLHELFCIEVLLNIVRLLGLFLHHLIDLLLLHEQLVLYSKLRHIELCLSTEVTHSLRCWHKLHLDSNSLGVLGRLFL